MHIRRIEGISYQEFGDLIRDCFPTKGHDGFFKLRNRKNAFTKSPFCEGCGKHLKKIALQIQVETKVFDFGPKCARYGYKAMALYKTLQEKP